MGRNGLLIAFICNHCPYVLAIIQRFVADAKKLQENGINVVAIMSNDYRLVPADSPEKMRQFALQQQFTFPYLVDQNQSVAKQYDAVCTPDFFGFDAAGKLRYRGRLDNVRMGNDCHRKPELLHAMMLVAADAVPIERQMPSMGCSIKWSPEQETNHGVLR